MCDGTKGMYIVNKKEKTRVYNILFEFAGDSYYVSIEGKGNLWRSLVGHDLENHDRLCDIITYDRIVWVNSDLPFNAEIIEGWNDILEKIQAEWDFKDCKVMYMERNELTWLEMHPIVNGVERYQVVDFDWSNCEHIIQELRMCDSPIGIIEDVYGMPIGSEDAIPCSEDHKSMEFIRETRKGTELIEKRYWPTEKEAIADAALCWNNLCEDDREHIHIFAGIIEEEYPVSGDIPIIVASFPDDL